MSVLSLNYVLTADKALQDVTSGKWTYVDIFSKVIMAKETGMAILDFWIVGKVCNVPKGSEMNIKIEIVSPSGKKTVSNPLYGVAETDDIEFGSRYIGMTIDEVGRYNINVLVNDDLMPSRKLFYFDAMKEEA